jgi:hypothetical protein
MGELGDEHPELCVGIVAKNWLMRSARRTVDFSRVI